MKLSLLALPLAAACLLVPPAAAQGRSGTAPVKLEVGQIAPPIGDLQWLTVGSAGLSETRLAALRGKVVIVADYGYYCDSCVRMGLPTLKVLRAANAPDTLAAILLTVGIGDDTDALIQDEAAKLGLTGSVGLADIDGQSTPYLNMDAYGNLTYAFVVGRHGGIVWHGDPSRDRAAYVAAVGLALNAVPCAPLPLEADAFGPLLAPALREYVLGEFSSAEAQAQALLKKFGDSPKAQAVATSEQAQALLELVASTRTGLEVELEAAANLKQAERFALALDRQRRAFPKGALATRAKELELSLQADAALSAQVQGWLEWYALAAARPATFPAEKDPAGAKYAKELARFLKQPDAPGAQSARVWLEQYENLQTHK